MSAPQPGEWWKIKAHRARAGTPIYVTHASQRHVTGYLGRDPDARGRIYVNLTVDAVEPMPQPRTFAVRARGSTRRYVFTEQSDVQGAIKHYATKHRYSPSLVTAVPAGFPGYELPLDTDDAS